MKGSTALTSLAERILLVASIASFPIFTLVGIARPVWLDEANSILISSRGFAGLTDALSRDNNLPAYYCILSLWMGWLGNSEIAVRLLSGLMYGAGCAAAFALGRRIAGDVRTGAYSAFFYGTSILVIRQAQNIRMYALLGLVSALSTWALLRASDKDAGWRAWALVAAIDALGLFVHVWFGFLLAAQLVAVLLVERELLPRFAVSLAAAAVPFAVLWAPTFAVQIHNGATDWMPPFRPRFVLVAVLEFYGPWIAPVIYLPAGIAAWRARAAGERRVRLLFTMCVVSIAIPLAVCVFRPIYWPGRYTVIASAPLAGLLACVFARGLRRLMLAGMCLVLLCLQVGIHVGGREAAFDVELPNGQSDRSTAQFLLSRAAPGDAVVFTSLTRAATEYYFIRNNADHRFVKVSFPAEVASHLGWENRRLPPERVHALEGEAAGTARILLDVAARGRSIWLYDGYSSNINRFLKEKLDGALPPPREHPYQGPYHTRILEYRR